MNHSTSKRKAKAAPQVESTVLIEGIDKKLIKCQARADFTVGNSSVKEGETFFLVASERRKNRYYVVHFNEARANYQCSCGANCSQHSHTTTVKDQVMTSVVLPVKPEAPAMTPAATTQEVKEAKALREARAIIEAREAANRPFTPAEYKIVAKAAKAREQAFAREYRKQAAALAAS